MNRVKTAMFALALLSGLLAGSAAQAHDRRGHFHGHARTSVFIGIPLGAPWYYPPHGYYSYPQVTAIPASPPVYIEQGQSSQQQYWWYYCPSSQAYYPYVRQCVAAWQRVAPQPLPGQSP